MQQRKRVKFNLWNIFTSRYKRCFLILCIINFSIYVISPIYGTSYPLQGLAIKRYEWVEQYLDHLNKSSSPKDWIQFLFKIKKCLYKEGYTSSSLLELAHFYRNELENYGVTISEEDFNVIINLICEKSSNFILSKNHHSKKQQEETKVPTGLIIGFVKCLAGALLCIVPTVPTQAIGAGLVLSGINECLDEVKKQDEINERSKENSTGDNNVWTYTF